MPSAIGTADHVGNQLISGTPWDGRPHLEGLAIDASWSPNGLVDQSRKGASCRKRAQILTSAGFTLYSGSFVTEDPRQTVDEALGLSMFHVGANNLGVVAGGWSTRAVRGNISKSFQAFHACGGPDGNAARPRKMSTTGPARSNQHRRVCCRQTVHRTQLRRYLEAKSFTGCQDTNPRGPPVVASGPQRCV